MNEHTATPTSESVEEALSRAIEPALHDPPGDRPASLAERIAGLGPLPPDRAIPMPPPDRAIPMPPPDRMIEAERPVAAAAAVIEPYPAASVARQSYATPAASFAPGRPAAPVAAAPIPRVPNRVYEHLVEGDDDVIGLIAYSLYKHDKRQWLMTWRAQHGAEATADQIEAFVNGQMTSGQRERYRTAARQVLDSYALVAVDMEKPQITREAVAGRVEAAARKVETQGRWWRQIPGVVIGAILSVGILIGVIAILVALDFDVGNYLGIEAVPPAGQTNVVP